MSAYSVTGRARSATEHTAANPALELLERAGYIVRGVLYAVMGILALGLALGIGGAATDQSGSLLFITGNPFGKLVLLSVAVGLGAYSIWGFVRAIFDPLHRGKDASGVAERLGFAWSGIAYASLSLFALKLLVGAPTAKHQDGTQTAIATILSYPAGRWLAVGIGLVAIAVGIGQFVIAYKATFKQDLKRSEMSESERKIVDQLGRMGMVARGVVFTLVGWFVFQSGLHKDATQAHGFGFAFQYLLAQPYGRVILAAVALGFIALGIHSFACARWIRLLGSRA
jgi:hypothetical protein